MMVSQINHTCDTLFVCLIIGRILRSMGHITCGCEPQESFTNRLHSCLRLDVDFGHEGRWLLEHPPPTGKTGSHKLQLALSRVSGGEVGT